MALITESYETADEIPEGHKDFYVEKEVDGKNIFVLENIVALKSAKDHEKQQKKEIADKLKAAEDKLAEQAAAEKKKQEELDAAKKKQLEQEGNWEKLREIEEQKRLTDKKAADEEISSLRKELQEMREAAEKEKIGAYCGSISADIALDGANEALKMLIEVKRTKIVDGQLTILNRDGMAVSWNKEQLIEDLKTDPFFTHLIKGSQASGGGSAGGSGGSLNKKLEDMTEQERVQLFKEKPEKFREMVAAAQSKGK